MTAPAIIRAVFLIAFLCTLGGTWAPVGLHFAVAAAGNANADTNDLSFEEEEGVLQTTKKTNANCVPSSFDPSLLKKPCQLDLEDNAAPEEFSLVFPTQYGTFTADCVRQRAPVWADRVYKLARHGYYNSNYFFRVIPGKYIQFGTHGDPTVSNVYNYTSAPEPVLECSVLHPQPPDMPYCLASSSTSTSTSTSMLTSKAPHNCTGVPALSNVFGTLAMSTSYQEGVPGYPGGVTWNATAELFVNIGDNPWLDSHLFVPICTISRNDMESVVLDFPSFGEVEELGGTGPSLGHLYQDGNSYIESHPDWKASMAVTSTVSVCTAAGTTDNEQEADQEQEDPTEGNPASAGTIGRNVPNHHHNHHRMSRVASLVWKGIALWLISWFVLN
mmetsp:Transcript_22371/g.62310  ORF Transcript_22371/g.62310 Transcript_22371/m.62310 type:complete len:387 (+) Transcript_22371:74-1234(+)